MQALQQGHGVVSVGRYGFDLQYHMSDKDTQREVALGKIGIVFISQANRKVAPIPEHFLVQMKSLS